MGVLVHHTSPQLHLVARTGVRVELEVSTLPRASSHALTLQVHALEAAATEVDMPVLTWPCIDAVLVVVLVDTVHWAEARGEAEAMCVRLSNEADKEVIDMIHRTSRSWSWHVTHSYSYPRCMTLNLVCRPSI